MGACIAFYAYGVSEGFEVGKDTRSRGFSKKLEMRLFVAKGFRAVFKPNKKLIIF